MKRYLLCPMVEEHAARMCGPNGENNQIRTIKSTATQRRSALRQILPCECNWTAIGKRVEFDRCLCRRQRRQRKFHLRTAVECKRVAIIFRNAAHAHQPPRHFAHRHSRQRVQGARRHRVLGVRRPIDRVKRDQ